MRIIIIGGGVAAVEAALSARKTCEKCDIDIFSTENVLPYRKPLLPFLLSHDLDENRFFLHNEKFYHENNINIHLHCNVLAVDPEKQHIITDGGKNEKYDRLLLALGSQAVLPPIHVAPGSRFFTFNNFDDLKRIKSILPECSTAAVIGGGVLGLETAANLTLAGYSATVIERNEMLLTGILDKNASVFLRKLLQKQKQLTILTSTQVNSITPDKDQFVYSSLSGSVTQRIKSDIVIAATGTVPGKIKFTNLPAAPKLFTDDSLNLTLPGCKNIFAAGDCAISFFNGKSSYKSAMQQGFIAGVNIAGGNRQYRADVPEFRSMIASIRIYSAGRISGNDLQCQYEQDQESMQSLYYSQNRLCGCILIGKTENAGSLYEIISRNLSENQS